MRCQAAEIGALKHFSQMADSKRPCFETVTFRVDPHFQQRGFSFLIFCGPKRENALGLSFDADFDFV